MHQRSLRQASRPIWRRAFPCPALVPAAVLSVLLSLAWAAPVRAELPPEWRGWQHALALGSKPKYPKGFAHFDYANPKAPKGGTMVLPADGGYDTLNPFTLKGRPPNLLGDLVFETLTTGSLDEPFTSYGLLAESMRVAPDELSIEFKLNPKARFSDGKPVTAQDVAFSFEILRSPAATPSYRYYYHDVKSVEAVGPLEVKMTFARRNRELPLIVGQLPILPQHVYGKGDFGGDFVGKAVGSGPYAVQDFAYGKYIRYQRRADYWGRDLPVNVGRYNADTVMVKFYREETVRLEGFKAGEFDFMWVNFAKQWARDMQGDLWDKHYVVKELLKNSNVQGMQGFAFNTRRPIFADRRVREALGLAFDFDWSNKTLFFGQYTANDSFFSNSEMAARGLPSKEELALLNPLRKELPQEVFTRPMGGDSGEPKDLRDRLRAAEKLLKEAGWEIKGDTLTETKTGREMSFVVTLDTPAFQRIVEPYLNNLRRIGVKSTMRVVDDSLYQRALETKDFDMIVQSFPQSQSPGNEQRDFWSSASADQPGSRNIVGIKNPAVDRLVDDLVQAHDRKALVTACRALDRVLWFEYYVVPHWYIAAHRVTYWNKFARAAKPPLYYNPFAYLSFWWIDPVKAAALEKARASGQPLPN